MLASTPLPGFEEAPILGALGSGFLHLCSEPSIRAGIDAKFMKMRSPVYASSLATNQHIGEPVFQA
jgi:hypothetical protein